MIDDKELPGKAKCLIVKDPRCAQFYLLPKIHKSGNPGRPVISNISCPTYHISKLLSSILKPIVSVCESYVKDTTRLLKILDTFQFDKDSSNKTLFTMDVKGLYTHIPNNGGILALKYSLNKRDNQQISTDTILRLAEMVLTLNCFEFNGDFFAQVGGTMMGTPFGPEYACLFMSYEEEKIREAYI